MIKHHTASVIIISESKPAKTLLMHHRKLDRWMNPGGHIEETENPYEAAIREAKEETGVDIAQYLGVTRQIDEWASYLPQPKYLLEEKIADSKEADHFHIDAIYVVRVPEQVVQKNNESHDIRWYTLEEVEALETFENLKELLRREMK